MYCIVYSDVICEGFWIIVYTFCDLLPLPGEHPTGCTVFNAISVNISKEESGIKQDKETVDDTPCYNKVRVENLVECYPHS